MPNVSYMFLESELEAAAGLAYIHQFASITCSFIYSTSIVIWSAINSVRFHESGDFVVVFKCNFYIGVSEEVCDFPDLWGYIG